MSCTASETIPEDPVLVAVGDGMLVAVATSTPGPIDVTFSYGITATG